ncbi:hypothetical protein AMECASPLE_027869 [Ameca splendens]|uniref:Uncharacterized protein n=1 Tax=Ameca splendens TaxID=208324 RepID=A0ABV0XU86_9TELE
MPCKERCLKQTRKELREAAKGRGLLTTWVRKSTTVEETLNISGSLPTKLSWLASALPKGTDANVLITQSVVTGLLHYAGVS